MLKINYTLSVYSCFELFEIIHSIKTIKYSKPANIKTWHQMVYDGMNKICKVYRSELKKANYFATLSMISTSGIMQIQVLDIAGNKYEIEIDMCMDKEILVVSLPLSKTAVIFTPQYYVNPVK